MGRGTVACILDAVSAANDGAAALLYPVYLAVGDAAVFVVACARGRRRLHCG